MARTRVAADLVHDGTWPESGKKSLDDLAVLLSITWKSTPDGVFTRFHVSDVWLDDFAMQRASHNQTETHKAFIRSCWMPGWIDAVEYGKFGTATVTATLFGGMDDSLYTDFKKGVSAMMNPVENTLKHTHGAYGPCHMVSQSVLEVKKLQGKAPLGSSGIQVRFKTHLILKRIRTRRVVRLCPESWPQVQISREEYLGGNKPAERFPTPDIFPKY